MTTKVPPIGPKSASIYFLGQAPGAEEVDKCIPFVGKTSFEFDRILRELGVDRKQCRLGNVFQTKPPYNYKPDEEDIANYVRPKPFLNSVQFNGGYVLETVVEQIRACWKDILETKPNVIIALGDVALWAITGQFGIQARRGFVIQSQLGIKCVPSFHPAYIVRDYSSRWLVKHDIRRGLLESETREISDPGFKNTIRPTFEQARSFLSNVLARLEIAPVVLSCDIETRAGHIACIGFGSGPREAICIPFMCVEDPRGYWSADEETSLVGLLRQVFAHPNSRLVGQNFLFDAQYIEYYWHVRPYIWRDTAVLQHTLFPMFRKALDFMVTLYSKHPRYWKKDGKTWDYSIPEEVYWNYNCMDCGYTYEVWQVLEALVDTENKREQLEFMDAVHNGAVEMMNRGVLVDEKKQAELRDHLKKLLEEKQAFLDYVVGHPFNPNSHKQMKEFFYNDLNMKVVIDRKTKKPSCNEDALIVLARREPILRPISIAVASMRSMRTFKSNFLEAEVHADKRMRCTFTPWKAKTYRFTSSKDVFNKGTNLQNVPSGMEIPEIVREAGGRISLEELQQECRNRGLKVSDIDEEEDKGHLQISETNEVSYIYSLPNIRRIFIPDPGYTIFDMDLDRADLQVVVWEAGDEKLKHILRNNIDMHFENAKELGITRAQAKVFVHLTDYGGSARTAAISCGLTVAEAERGQKRWFSAHPGFLEYHKRIRRNLAKDGVVWNKFGFNYKFLGRPELEFSDALAWPPQSTVANVINKAFLNIRKNVPFVQFLLQVHDSLVFQIPNEMVTNDNVQIIRSHAAVRVPYDDPLVIPVSFKASRTSWGDCRKWVAA